MRRGGAKVGRVLVVDDNDDVRQMLAVALQTEGHEVEEAADAEQAVQRLRDGRFDVVLTDYDLPDKTGAVLLREAAASGLLGDATVLIVTAHTQPEDTAGYDVIRKPINLDQLMAQVRGVLRASARKGSPPAAADGGTPCAELVLYVAGNSAASVKARRNMEQVLRRFAECPIRYAVRDVAEEPAKAEEDRIVFAPTLVKRTPGPPAWVLGDLADAAVIVDLLKVCGMKPTS